MDMTHFGQESGPFDYESLVIHCPRCHSPMELHQPDPELAERLLATCGECKAWFLANSLGNTLIQLPDSRDEDDTQR
jgi:hypothetical protein